MNTKKQLKVASSLGVKVIRDKSLDKLSGKVLFPENWNKLIKLLLN